MMATCKLFHPHNDQVNIEMTKTLLHTMSLLLKFCSFMKAVAHVVDYGERYYSRLKTSVL